MIFVEPLNLESSIILRTKGVRRKGRQSKGNLAEAKTGQHILILTLTLTNTALTLMLTQTLTETQTLRDTLP